MGKVLVDALRRKRWAITGFFNNPVVRFLIASAGREPYCFLLRHTKLIKASRCPHADFNGVGLKVRAL